MIYAAEICEIRQRVIGEKARPLLENVIDITSERRFVAARHSVNNKRRGNTENPERNQTLAPRFFIAVSIAELIFVLSLSDCINNFLRDDFDNARYHHY